MKRFLLFSTVLLSTFSSNIVANEVRLNWQFKYEADYGTDAGIVKFSRAKIHRDSIVFDAILHNNHKDRYQCFYMSTSDNQLHLDDELGNEYPGFSLTFNNGQSNKLALNQRKKIRITIPKPVNDVTLVNLHLGMYFHDIGSGKQCDKPIVKYGLNFHKLDWDVSELMASPES